MYGLFLVPHVCSLKASLYASCLIQFELHSCTAQRTNLDNPPTKPTDRTKELHEVIGLHCSAKSQWEDWGIVADSVVRASSPRLRIARSLLLRNLQPFTNDFPHSDSIHELIAPDILHQLIKGAFKDHFVTWVEQFVKSLPGGAEKLAQIDRR